MKKSMKKQANHMWTKEEIKKLYTLWNELSMEEMCEELGLEPKNIRYMVSQMRKNGFNLQKKKKNGRLMSMLQDVKKELKIK